MTAFRWLYLFIRVPALSYTALLPLLGAGTVSPALEPPHLVAILAVALTFHAFAYVTNDVIDLPVDRTDRWRTAYPLVRGSISRRSALAIALTQIPAAFAITSMMGWSIGAHFSLLAATVLMTAYNLWGKRCSVPLVTDAVQGFAWVALVMYGAWTVGRPGPVTGLLAAHTFVFTLMVNGVHGALRDLENDWRCRVRTTAIFLGARPLPGSGIELSGQMIAYVLFLQGGLILITFLRLVHAWTSGSAIPAITAMLTVALTGLSLGLPARAFRSLANAPALGLVGTVHLVLSQAVLASLYGGPLNASAAIAVLLVFTMPVLAMWAHNGATWG